VKGILPRLDADDGYVSITSELHGLHTPLNTSWGSNDPHICSHPWVSFHINPIKIRENYPSFSSLTSTVVLNGGGM